MALDVQGDGILAHLPPIDYMPVNITGDGDIRDYGVGGLFLGVIPEAEPRRIDLSGLTSPILPEEDVMCFRPKKRRQSIVNSPFQSVHVDYRYRPDYCWRTGTFLNPPEPCCDKDKFDHFKQNIDECSLILSPALPMEVPVLHGSNVRFVEHDGRPQCIGYGHFGVVYAGYLKKDDGTEIKVAIKVFKVRAGQSKDTVVREAAFMQYLGDTGVTPVLHGLVPLKPSDNFLEVALVSELLSSDADEGFTVLTLPALIDSHQMVHENQDLPNASFLSKQDWLQLVHRLFVALKTVNDKGIALNDFKVDNIVVRRSATGVWVPYIVDFGTARWNNTNLSLNTTYAPNGRNGLQYLAPELFDGCNCSDLTDLYSLGFLLDSLARVINVPVLKRVATGLMATKQSCRMTLMEAKKLVGQTICRSKTFRRRRGRR